jgi:hypothetical protein
MFQLSQNSDTINSILKDYPKIEKKLKALDIKHSNNEILY